MSVRFAGTLREREAGTIAILSGIFVAVRFCTGIVRPAEFGGFSAMV